MTGLQEDIIKKIMEIYNELENLLELYDIPKGVKAIFAFFHRNIDHYNNQEGLWSVRWKMDTTIEAITERVVWITWLALKLGREVNIIRHAYGRLKVDFIQEATNYDITETSQQQRKETDQEGEDGGVPETAGP